jgi:flagellar assembly factor FliW
MSAPTLSRKSPILSETMTETPVLPQLRFESGLVGFPDARQYFLADAGGGAFELTSLDEGGSDFVVVAPAVFFPDYAPVIDDVAAARLDLHSAEEALLLLVVTLGPRPEDATANLLAPIIVNQRTRAAAQVVLNGQAFPLRATLLPA